YPRRSREFSAEMEISRGSFSQHNPVAARQALSFRPLPRSPMRSDTARRPRRRGAAATRGAPATADAAPTPLRRGAPEIRRAHAADPPGQAGLLRAPLSGRPLG